MTPQEATNTLLATGYIWNIGRTTDAGCVGENRRVLMELFESVATTAKADETRRCAKLVRDCSVSWKSQRWTFELIADDILRTGDLKVANEGSA